MTPFPTKTRNKESYSELTNQLTIQLCLDISMFVCVSRKFEHGLLFCYESRIIGGGGVGVGGSKGDSSDKSADVLEYNSKLKCLDCRVVTKIATYIFKNYVVHKANDGYRGIIRTLSILDPTSAHRKRAVFKQGRIMFKLMFSSLLKYQLKKRVAFAYERWSFNRGSPVYKSFD